MAFGPPGLVQYCIRALMAEYSLSVIGSYRGGRPSCRRKHSIITSGSVVTKYGIEYLA